MPRQKENQSRTMILDRRIRYDLPARAPIGDLEDPSLWSNRMADVPRATVEDVMATYEPTQENVEEVRSFVETRHPDIPRNRGALLPAGLPFRHPVRRDARPLSVSPSPGPASLSASASPGLESLMDVNEDEQNLSPSPRPPHRSSQNEVVVIDNRSRDYEYHLQSVQAHMPSADQRPPVASAIRTPMHWTGDVRPSVYRADPPVTGPVSPRTYFAYVRDLVRNSAHPERYQLPSEEELWGPMGWFLMQQIEDAVKLEDAPEMAEEFYYEQFAQGE